MLANFDGQLDDTVELRGAEFFAKMDFLGIVALLVQETLECQVVIVRSLPLSLALPLVDFDQVEDLAHATLRLTK